jgi:hypothetical protein
MFNFTPLLGAQSASPASQSLLEFDGGIKVLIDAGWDEGFDVAKLKEIEKYVIVIVSLLWLLILCDGPVSMPAEYIAFLQAGTRCAY